MDSQRVVALARHLTGETIVPTSPNYDTHRRVFSHTGNPAVIVRVGTDADIAATIAFAREQRLPLSIRSGGHASTGLATNDGGVVLDLAHMSAVTVLNPETRLVRIQAGAHWGDVASALAPHGLAISSGDSNQVGVGGLTLGGGIGWLARTAGLTIDSLRAAELVTAEGEVLRISAESHPDLFWAIRGGGGNFGVVTSFDFEAWPCEAVVGGSAIYEAYEARAILARWASAMRDAPDELNATLVLTSGLDPQTPPHVVIHLCYAGESEEAAREAIAPFLHLGALRSASIQVKPYAAMLEDTTMLPPSLMLVSQNGFVKTLSDEVFDALAATHGRAGAPSAQIRHLGGAVARVSPHATAFAHRDSAALLFVPVQAARDTPPADIERLRRAAWQPLAPWTTGAYGNFLSDVSEQRVAEVYPPETRARLVRVKARYDPENIFNQNLNITPTVLW